MEYLTVAEEAERRGVVLMTVRRWLIDVPPEGSVLIRGKPTATWSERTLDAIYERLLAENGIRNDFRLLQNITHNLGISRVRLMKIIDYLKMEIIVHEGREYLRKDAYNALRDALTKIGYVQRAEKYNKAIYKVAEAEEELPDGTWMSANAAAAHLEVWPSTIRTWMSRDLSIPFRDVRGKNRNNILMRQWKLGDIKAQRDSLCREQMAHYPIREELTLALYFGVTSGPVRAAAAEIGITPFKSGSRKWKYTLEEYKLIKQKMLDLGYRAKRR